MKKVNKSNFTSEEIEILKKHYKLEITKAEEKVRELKITFKNLIQLGKGVSGELIKKQRNNIKINANRFLGTRNMNSADITKPVKKNNSTNISWTNLIIDTLKSKKTLLPSKAFMEVVQNKYKIKQEEKKRTRSNITGCLSDLTKKNNRLIRYGEHGEKKGLYGLAEWFDSKGRLQAAYKQKIINL